MRRYTYIEETVRRDITRLPERTLAWFAVVHGNRLIRQYERHNPGFLAVAYAEAHLGRVVQPW